MRRLSFKRKVVAAAVAGGIGLAGAVGAWAYFSTTGAGTATGATGQDTPLVIHGTFTPALYPGTSATVTFTVDNPSTGHEYLNTIHLASVTTDKTGCAVADYTMPDVVVGQDYASGSGQAVSPTGTITMANNGNQDNCKNATVTLHLTSN